jgi:medium-chain acyl-[acyl-carrier-protein] hydrolase
MDLRFYTKKHIFTYSDFDTNDNIFPSALLNCFQDVAGEHADLLKVGYKDLLNNSNIWVLDKLRFEIISSLKVNEEYTIKTWPLQASILQFQREYLILDSSNNIVVKASSIWCVINIESRKLVRAKQINFNIDNYLQDKAFDDSFILFKTDDLSTYSKGICENVKFSELDHNKHMNNVKYSILSIDTIPNIVNLKIKSMQINFQKECIYNDKLQTYYKKDNNLYTIVGVKNDSVTSFICYIKFDTINNGD